MKGDGVATVLVLLIMSVLFIVLQASFSSMQQLYQLALFRKKHHQAFWHAQGALRYAEQVIKKHRSALDALLERQHEVQCTIDPWPLDKHLKALLCITKQGNRYVVTSQILEKHTITFSLQEKLCFGKKGCAVEEFSIVTL